MRSKKLKIIVITIVSLVLITAAGFGIYRSRYYHWHKLDFKVDSIAVSSVVSETDKFSPQKTIYDVVLKGSVKAWYFDNNTYKFNLCAQGSGSIVPTYYENTDILTVTNDDFTKFEIHYKTDTYDYIKSIGARAQNTYVNNELDENVNIQLYLHDYPDKIAEIDNNN